MITSSPPFLIFIAHKILAEITTQHFHFHPSCLSPLLLLLLAVEKDGQPTASVRVMNGMMFYNRINLPYDRAAVTSAEYPQDTQKIELNR